MTAATDALWPWLALAGLGFFHGINPAMGWLFAVALGLHRQRREIVLLSWIPIALGHAAAVAAVLFAVLAFGLVMDHAALQRTAGALLSGWAIWHAVRRHQRRIRFGMRTGLAGLAVWSFLMSSAHGAGLMLIPVLLPLCGPGSAHTSLVVAAVALGVHTTAMLATIAVVSVIVYDWLGLAFLRTGWVNFDLLWIAVLGICGAILLLV
jgi:hypothetical protein